MSARQLHALHDEYCLLSGFEPKYAVYEGAYHHFIKSGHTQAELRTMLLFCQRENSRFRNGIGYKPSPGKVFDYKYEWFCSVLAEARARQRNRRVPRTGREQVLALYQRPVIESVQLTQAKSVKDILRSLL